MSCTITKQLIVLTLGALAALPLAAADATELKLEPGQALWRLRTRNQAFAAGRIMPSNATPARRAALVAAQHPLATILTCADSRVPPEYIFNEGMGKLFVVRVAGVVADPVVVGSVEYAAEHLHVPLVVVMGHTRCGAVKAALDSKTPEAPGGPGENLETILSLLRPGLTKGQPQSDPWRTAVFGGVEQSVSDLMRLSKILPEMAREGHVAVVGAVYEIETGKVLFSDVIPADGKPAAGESARLLEWHNSKNPAPVRIAKHAHRAAE